MKHRASLLCTAVLLVSAIPARANSITPFDKNLDLINTLALSTISMLPDTFVFEGETTFDYAGTYTDTDWQFNIAGQLGANDISIDYFGTFDLLTELGSFTSAGASGAFSWSGFGDYQYTSSGPFNASLTGEWEADIAGLGRTGDPVNEGRDRHVTKGDKEKVDDDGKFEYYEQKITIVRTYRNDQGGEDVVGTEEKVIKTKKRKPQTPTETEDDGDGGGTIIRDDDEDGIPGRTSSSAFQYHSGVVTGSVATVPEPASIILLGSGAAVLLWRQSRRRRR